MDVDMEHVMEIYGVMGAEESLMGVRSMKGIKGVMGVKGMKGARSLKGTKGVRGVRGVGVVGGFACLVLVVVPVEVGEPPTDADRSRLKILFRWFRGKKCLREGVLGCRSRSGKGPWTSVEVELPLIGCGDVVLGCVGAQSVNLQ